MRLVAGVALLVMSVQGCDNAFSPKGQYQERLVVFCALDASQPAQIVRLESTYDAVSTNPDNPVGKRVITNARVSVASDKRVFVFRDTVISDGAGGTKTIWISRDLVPEEGKTYTLSVSVPDVDAVSAQVQVPSRTFIKLTPPLQTEAKKGVELSAGAISTNAPAKGFYFRLWVRGEKYVNGVPVAVRREVPIGIDQITGDTLYSKPSRETAAVFPTDLIAMTRARLEREDFATNFDIVGTGYAMDSYMYSYFQTVRGFDDPVSVRQDRPDISNIRGGVGIFGAIVADSTRNSYLSIIIGT